MSLRDLTYEQFDRLASYAFGMSSTPPAMTELDADPDRVAGFVKQFLTDRGLQVRPRTNGSKRKANSMSTATLDRSEATDFREEARRRAKELGVPVHETMSQLSDERPDLYAKHSDRAAHAVSPEESERIAAMHEFIDEATVMANVDNVPLYAAMSTLCTIKPSLYRSFAGTDRTEKVKVPQKPIRYFGTQIRVNYGLIAQRLARRDEWPGHELTSL